MSAATKLAKAGSRDQEKIEEMAKILNNAVPSGTDGGVVLAALAFLIRIGFGNHIEDPEERLRVYDELVAGNRALMMKDAGLPTQ